MGLSQDYLNEMLKKAARYGHIEIVRLMIEHGANNFDEAIPDAARCGHINIVKLLEEAEAKTESKV